MAQRHPEYAAAAARMEAAVAADPRLAGLLERNGYIQGHQRAWEYHRSHGIEEGVEHRFSMTAHHCNNQIDPHAAQRKQDGYVKFSTNTPIGKLRRRNATFKVGDNHQKMMERAVAAADRAGDNSYITMNKQDGENRDHENPTKDNARAQAHLNSGAWASFEVDRKGVAVDHLLTLEALGAVPDILVFSGDLPSWRIQCHFALDGLQNNQTALRALNKLLCGYHGRDEEGNHEAVGDTAATGAMNLFRLPGSMIFATDEKIARGYAEYNVALTYTKPLDPIGFEALGDIAESLFPEGISPSDIKSVGVSTIDVDSPVFDTPADPGKPRASYQIVEDFVASQLAAIGKLEEGGRFEGFRAAVAALACAGPDGYNTHTNKDLYERCMAAFPGDNPELKSRNSATTIRGFEEYGSLRSAVIDDRSGLFAFEQVATAAAPVETVVLMKLQAEASLLDMAKAANYSTRRRTVLSFASYLGRELRGGSLAPTWAAYTVFRSAVSMKLLHKDISLENFITSDLGSQLLLAVGVKVKA